ncbi:hypothetical protein [Pedobacter mendelii]|uniref:hypothetical protein n=1 Tax=Pedobacter mendelii TaxID=1908240 RepID=UPI00166D5186|nr:hypothetical protein [Pedobacter mendelii]
MNEEYIKRINKILTLTTNGNLLIILQLLNRRFNDVNSKVENDEPLARVLQKWRFGSPLISASTFGLKTYFFGNT